MKGVKTILKYFSKLFHKCTLCFFFYLKKFYLEFYVKTVS